MAKSFNLAGILKHRQCAMYILLIALFTKVLTPMNGHNLQILFLFQLLQHCLAVALNFGEDNSVESNLVCTGPTFER